MQLELVFRVLASLLPKTNFSQHFNIFAVGQGEVWESKEQIIKDTFILAYPGAASPPSHLNDREPNGHVKCDPSVIMSCAQ